MSGPDIQIQDNLLLSNEMECMRQMGKEVARPVQTYSVTDRLGVRALDSLERGNGWQAKVGVEPASREAMIS